jgi:hypothetical protein
MTAVQPAPSISRPVHLRIARLHLRLAAHELARAELEAAAGDGSLDEEALLDLAEVRWRTGDLPGAGVAANAYLSTGRDEALGLAIAAEAAGAAGHTLEARDLAARTLAAIHADAAVLDQLFAGMGRSTFWPIEPDVDAAPAAGLFGEELVGTEALAEGTTPDADGPSPPLTGDAEGPGLWGDEPSSAGPRVDRPASLAAARAALASGDVTDAADRLSALLRDRPDLAAAVLAALDEVDEEPQPAIEAAGDDASSDAEPYGGR